MKKKDVAIIGYSETKINLQTGRSAYDLAGETFSLILDSVGIKKSEIDGLSVTNSFSEGANPLFASYMCDALGLTVSWLQVNGIGGASALCGVARAASAIRGGLCQTALVISADAPTTAWRSNFGAYRNEFQDPIGINGPPEMFGLIMTRYKAEYGLKVEALAKIALIQREHALLNKNACSKLKTPLTLNDYFNSRMISDPLRLLDCVMFCDGANAILLTKPENAKKLGIKKMVYPVVYAELTNFNGDKSCPNITETGFSIIGPSALRKAEMTPKDVKMFHPYDDFTIAVLMQMEQIGFCHRGEGSDFILMNEFSYNGSLPLNTGGGQLSAGQPGLAGGGVNLVEAIRQMFGEAGERQVQNPGNAIVTGIGVIPYARNWATSNIMILEV